ncbi:MAG: acetylxylan esterase, partial [Candidatus Bathyarchaeia archaeon]
IYPSLAEVEAYWSEALSEVPTEPELVQKVDRTRRPEEAYDYHAGLGTWLMFKGVDGNPFWCLWQPCLRPGIHKALVHLPGYGTEVSAHPSLVHAGFHVLHVNPRGYCGPEGFANREWREPDGTPSVLFRNLDRPREYGYRLWFQDAVIAVRWLQRQKNVGDRLGFYGTSQGGGASLLLASLVSAEGVVGAVAADVPFLTNFPMAFAKQKRGAYEVVFSRLPRGKDLFRESFRTLGFVDTVVHAPRMRYPVLLTAGELDEACPSDTVRSLYKRLPATRALVEFQGQGHAYTPSFLSLAQTWFSLHL